MLRCKNTKAANYIANTITKGCKTLYEAMRWSGNVTRGAMPLSPINGFQKKSPNYKQSRDEDIQACTLEEMQDLGIDIDDLVDSGPLLKKMNSSVSLLSSIDGEGKEDHDVAVLEKLLAKHLDDEEFAKMAAGIKEPSPEFKEALCELYLANNLQQRPSLIGHMA